MGVGAGYCTMIGGEAQVAKHLDPIFKSLAPGPGDVLRAPGRDKLEGAVERGCPHCGPNGAGHFVKMVHNGIEYGVMAAYAEGPGVLHEANIGKQGHASDAETTPLRGHELYQSDFTLRDIAEVWRRGGVIASWLLDLTATALVEDPELAAFSGRVSDSGEGRWTIKAAIDEAAPSLFFPPRSIGVSTLAAPPIFRTSCFGRCVTSLAGAWRKPPANDHARKGGSYE